LKGRAIRIHHNERVMKNRLKLLKNSSVSNRHPDVNGKTYYDIVAEKPHALVKKHPFDCGNPKCMICHSEKVLGKRKASERKRMLKLKEDSNC